MSSPSFYDIDPPYRIQKRLVLNQCYKAVSQDLAKQPVRLTYVTLGGAELYDVLDLLCVFDISKSELSVISYERDPEVALLARRCHVAKALSQMSSFSLDVVPRAIGYDSLDPVENAQNKRPFIFFLDFFTPFSELNQSVVYSLLTSGCLRPGDYLMVTSSLTQRVLHQQNFMNRFVSDFRHYFGLADGQVTTEFKVRNHVDLLIAQAVMHSAKGNDGEPHVNANLMAKYKYQDTRTPMGVWLYKLEQVTAVPSKLTDMKFIEYPWPISLEESAIEPPKRADTFFRSIAERRQAKKSSE